MGIKHLNRFLKEQCNQSIQRIHFDKLKGKTIVIDTSIYMYKFVSENALIENIYLMLSIFRHYQITPIFVFDGKPPDDKLELLKQRKMDKLTAEQEYELLKKNEHTDTEYLISLKKQFTYLTKKQFADVKHMIHAFGVEYIESPGESDEVCAQMVLKGDAYAVVSEDMDMFVYGCPVVLRYTSLLNHTTVLYDTSGILSELGITQTELREICVLAGTDYNKENDHDLFQVLKWFKKYHKSEVNQNGFYNWLQTNGVICEEEHTKLTYICGKFQLRNVDYEIKPHTVPETNTIVKLLTEEGFLFPPKRETAKQLQIPCL